MTRMIDTRPRRRQRMNPRPSERIRCDAHLQWVRRMKCALDTTLCSDKIEACHVRTGTDGGTGIKPSDSWVIPMCSTHHREQHQCGEPAFERRYIIDMKEIAQALWQASPHGVKYRIAQERNGE